MNLQKNIAACDWSDPSPWWEEPHVKQLLPAATLQGSRAHCASLSPVGEWMQAGEHRPDSEQGGDRSPENDLNNQTTKWDPKQNTDPSDICPDDACQEVLLLLHLLPHPLPAQGDTEDHKDSCGGLDWHLARLAQGMCQGGCAQG